jgi:nitroimidazol reductase NimA-like FMN-containing flavoprotein (pyridoxamine 5'-phosphate oxidase superfamily)
MTPESDLLAGHEMTDEEIAAFLTEQGTGVLSMADDGAPYGVPLSFGFDGEDRLYFLFAGHSAAGEKVTFAERSETATFTVYDVADDDSWRSVIVEGGLDRIVIDDWKAARRAMADNAYRPDLLADVDEHEDPRVWALDVEEWSGRRSDAD